MTKKVYDSDSFMDEQAAHLFVQDKSEEISFQFHEMTNSPYHLVGRGGFWTKAQALATIKSITAKVGRTTWPEPVEIVAF